MRRAPLAAVLVLAACVDLPPGSRDGGGDPGAAPAFTLDESGIAIAGSPLRIDFGRHRPGVIETVTRLQGRSPAQLSGPEVCGPGLDAVRWPDGLVLVFRDEAFRGWQVPAPGRSVGEALSSGAQCGPS